MASEVEICNLALGHIGQSVAIASLSEQSKAARICARNYAQARDELLAATPWRFARKSIALAQLTETPFPGYAYAYAQPEDCLNVHRVCPEAGIRAHWRAVEISLTQPHRRHEYADRIPFEVVMGVQGTAIATDLKDAFLLYTARVTNTSRFTPMFVNALAWSLASKIAMPMAVDANLAGRADQGAAMALVNASALMLNESQDDRPPVPESIAARG